MTVKELIEKLEQMPPDAVIGVFKTFGGSGKWDKWEHIQAVTYADGNWDKEFQAKVIIE